MKLLILEISLMCFGALGVGFWLGHTAGRYPSPALMMKDCQGMLAKAGLAYYDTQTGEFKIQSKALSGDSAKEE